MYSKIVWLMIMIVGLNASLIFNTNHNFQTTFDCFYADLTDDASFKIENESHINYLTPYCRRLSSNDSSDSMQGHIQNNYTFKSLRSQRIRSEDLLQWSIAVDIIEQYAIYLLTNNSALDEILFHNCSLSWFGSQCQYTFGSNIIIDSFGDFVNFSFANRKQFKKQILIHTCYPHLSGCYLGPEPMCLDWREICNGIINCIGKTNFGIDEEHCHELEVSKCEESEYRCHNGAQCIPLEFFRDGWINKDCLDGTDEDNSFQKYSWLPGLNPPLMSCISVTTFNCEEITCRYPHYYTCGIGTCSLYFPIINKLQFKDSDCATTLRDVHFSQGIYASAKQLPDECYRLLFCKLKFYNFMTDETYTKQNCRSPYNCTMKYIPFPAEPLFNGYFQLLYLSKSLIRRSTGNVAPNYICTDPRRCQYFQNATFQREGLNCYPFQQLYEYGIIEHMFFLSRDLRDNATFCNLMRNNHNNYTSDSSLFYCEQSQKYISKHRLIDNHTDCYYKEDETYPYSCSLNHTQRIRCTSEEKCLSPLGIGINLPDCKDQEDVELSKKREIFYPQLCNDIPDFVQIGDETDETNCQWWPCLNPYTRCDKISQCAHGIDELNCPNTDCGINEYKCQDSDSNEYYCIPQAYIYEQSINCTDDSFNGPCRMLFYSNDSKFNINNEYIPWKDKTCLTRNDICKNDLDNGQYQICNTMRSADLPFCIEFKMNIYENQSLCALFNDWFDIRESYPFSTWNLGYLPSTINTTSLIIPQVIPVQSKNIPSMNISIELFEYCNRGILIYEGKLFEKKCLCPPNYYGHRCQWQNQRVSLTLRIKKFGSTDKTIFIYEIFIYLIDDQNGIIHYYEKINYIPSIDCETKYNRYLLYPTKPKSLNHTYSIHIDIYDKLKLEYYGSWYLNIPFPFLPVNRIATKLFIPIDKSHSSKTCSLNCGIHGECFYYFNSNKSFCHCHENYSGRFCNIPSDCPCSSDSVCLNSSICLCPLNKFGSKCYLKHSFCQYHNNPCKNNGQCIPTTDRINPNGFTCLCKEDSMGSNCEYKQNKIDLIFKTDLIPSIIFSHFITGFDHKEHELVTTSKKVPFNQDSISLYIRQPFHILLIEYFNQYYLAVLRENYIPSEHITTDIKKDDMCFNVTKLLNSTILNNTSLHRMKYYQLPCLNNLKLKCFYDEEYMCICDRNRFSNCFDFNHNIPYDCQGYNVCDNGGKCFQNNVSCPTAAVCMCEKCYYGNKCQLTTKGFSLSLDVIFGYHIKPNTSFMKQSIPVKITASITLLMFAIGIVNGIFSVLTFRRKNSLQVGCGIYLLTNSVISLITIITFTIKYWQLVVFQMNVIQNRSFISFSCLLTDVLLKIFVSSGDWFNACVGIERAFAAIQGVHFNKLKSKSMAKYIIPIILLSTSVSYIHDPISRELFDDIDEERTWCISNYSTNIKVFDRFINSFHFFTAFILNLLSALMIIIQVFRLRAKVEKTATRKDVLYGQIRRHKHLLIAPCVLVLLAIPRLIISFSSRCMESARNPWLFLIGYYISFVPPLLLFIVFVLPSDKYKEEFFTVVRRTRANIKLQ